MLFPERSLESMRTCSKSIAGLVMLYGITAGAAIDYAMDFGEFDAYLYD